MKRFTRLLSKAIDDTMKTVFGKSVSESIYRLVENHALLKREEVGEKIEVFFSRAENLNAACSIWCGG